MTGHSQNDAISKDASITIDNAWRLAGQQQPEQALKLLEDLLNRDPANISAWLAAGSILQHHGEFKQAAETYRRVLALDPQHDQARRSLAVMLITIGALAEAEPLVDRIAAGEPHSPHAWALLAVLRQKQVRDREAAEAFRQSLALRPHAIHHSNLLQILQYMDDVAPGDLLAAHRQWAAAYSSSIHPPPALASAASKRSRRLRLGFVSADFGRHPTGFLALRPIECLDKSQCSVICYYDRLPEDDFTARFRAAADDWRVTAAWSDDQLADQIRADQIDILFDLMGHTGARLLTFARRLAPLQVTWLGYVGTTGLEQMDYLLADRFHVREGEERFYSEQIIRLPHDYACYGPPDNAPDVGPLPALAKGHVTFGCFNNGFKLSSTILDAWAAILQRVPGSQLLIKNRSLNQPEFRDRLHLHFARRGIPPERVVLEAGSEHHELLASYNGVDLALDTQPYSGGLTTCEALWMGVPVITFPGRTFAGRHSVSHLINAGYEQFVAPDLAGYVELAVSWAGRLDELATNRSQMRERVRNSPLCDAPQFASDLLTLLEDAWLQTRSKRGTLTSDF